MGCWYRDGSDLIIVYCFRMTACLYVYYSVLFRGQFRWLIVTHLRFCGFSLLFQSLSFTLQSSAGSGLPPKASSWRVFGVFLLLFVVYGLVDQFCFNGVYIVSNWQLVCTPLSFVCINLHMYFQIYLYMLKYLALHTLLIF